MDGPLSFSTCSYETVINETLIDPARLYREIDEGLAELRGASQTVEIPIVRRPPA